MHVGLHHRAPRTRYCGIYVYCTALSTYCLVYALYSMTYIQYGERDGGVGGGFLLKVGGFSLKLYSAVSCVYPDVS